MEPFIQKHDAIIEGVLSTFDRVLIKGYLPLSRPEVMASLMGQHGLLLKDFKRFVVEQSAAVGLHAKALAERAGRPYLYLRGAVRKEEMARAMALRDGVEEGLIGVFGVVEACQSFNLAYGKGKPRLQMSVLLLLLPGSAGGLHAHPAPKLVSVRDPSVCERPQLAGAGTDPDGRGFSERGKRSDPRGKL